MKKILVVLSLCVFASLSGTLSSDQIGQRDRKLILKNKLQPANKNIFGLLLVPYIICFFAATGIWPHFPQHMQSSVNDMGQQIFSQSDEHIRNFCRGKFLLNAQKPVFFKGILFPFVKPIEDWSHGPSNVTTAMPTNVTGKTTNSTAMAANVTAMPTTVTTVTPTTVTTVMPTTVTTVMPTTVTTVMPTTVTINPTTKPTATPLKEETTTVDVSVITFDPNQPRTSICNCNQPKLIKELVNATSVTIEKSVDTSPPTTQTEMPSTSATPPTHIKIEVKNVISLIDGLLAYFNLTRSSP